MIFGPHTHDGETPIYSGDEDPTCSTCQTIRQREIGRLINVDLMAALMLSFGIEDTDGTA